MLSRVKELLAYSYPGEEVGQSRYGLLHAVIAVVVLCGMIFSNGLASFWKQFVYGLSQTMTPKSLLLNLGVSTVFFLALIVVIWIIAWAGSRGARDRGGRGATALPEPELPERGKAILLAAVVAPVVTLLALGLNWLGASAIEWCTHVKPADQELVKCFLDGHYSLALRGVMVLTVLFQAPLLEEPIFRGIIFRGFTKAMPVWPALILSGAVFALVHVNAASFVAVWFLGIVFGWLYYRTRTILAPMTAHLLFNATNVVLLIFFPEVAS